MAVRDSVAQEGRCQARGRRLRHWAALALLFAWGAPSLVACESPEASEVVQRTAQPLSTYVISMPRGAGLGSFALVANGGLYVRDRAKLVDVEGAPAGAANAGLQETNVGVEASVGAISSAASVTLSDRAKVYGDITTQGSLQVGNSVLLGGVQRTNQTGLTPPDQETIEIEFGGTSLGNVTLEPPNSGEHVTSLAPGRYGQVVIKSRNRVNLVSGVYTFDTFQLEPQARIVVDDSAGPVLINVRDQVLYKGTLEGMSAQHPAVRFSYVGSQAVVLESPFKGTFLAPNASVRLATLSAQQRHVGSFFAKSIEVSPDVVVEFRPYFVYEATRDYEVSTSTYGKFGYAAIAPDGTVVGRVPNNVIKVETAGTHRKLLANDIEVQYLIDPENGAFGYYGDGTFERYRSDGVLLGSYSRSAFAQANFIPGTEKTAILLGNDRHEPDWARVKVVGGGTTSEFATPDLQLLRGTPTKLIYSTRSQLIVVTHAGAPAWSAPLALRDMVVATNGTALLGVRAEKGSSKVVRVNVANGAVTELGSLSEATWQLAIAPSGQYGVAATRHKLYVYKEGSLVRELALPTHYFASADINDQGEIVVGGATASGNTVLMVAGAAGTRPWVDATGLVDQVAARPYVKFQAGQPHFIAVRKEGLSRYTVKRGL